MRLYTFKSTKDVLGRDNIVRTFRWYLEVSEWHLSLTEEYLEDKIWHFAYNWYDIFICKIWTWGRERDYYDGPLDAFGLGFIRITWRDWNRKCYD